MNPSRARVPTCVLLPAAAVSCPGEDGPHSIKPDPHPLLALYLVKCPLSPLSLLGILQEDGGLAPGPCCQFLLQP